MTDAEKYVKPLLSLLLFGCLLPMPYGYFQLVRFLALIGFGILAFRSHEREKQTEQYIYIGLAILFQPFIKIALGRELWNIVDIIVGLGLSISWLKEAFSTRK